MQGSNVMDVVLGAPENIIEQNAFYARLKFALVQKNIEVSKLKELNATQKKEFDELKARYETISETHRQVEPVIPHSHRIKSTPQNDDREVCS